MVSMKIHKIGIAHHLKALRAGVQAGNQFSSRIGYKYLKEGSKMKYDQLNFYLEKTNEEEKCEEYCIKITKISTLKLRTFCFPL